uniref:Peter pan homolog n=1 Tax=Oncorhynchus kisutch TaxID=8019 RepID=A0A8C7J602_ONCKI
FEKNVLNDFVAVAGPLGVTHFMIFTKTPSSVNMRLARLPKGPMLHFRVTKVNVVSSLKRHRMHEQQFTHHPLLVLNNFGSEGMHVKLMATMFQNMFPSIKVHKVSLNAIKRCVLVNYDPVSQEIEFRHYSLKVVPVGMSRGVKKLMQEKFPNMSKFEDISDLLMKGANLSESDAEQDGDHNITELPQIYSGRGNMASQQRAVRLTEIGPRITMQLVKIEEGMGDGNILYHAVSKYTCQFPVYLALEWNSDVCFCNVRKRSMAGIKRKRQEEEEHDPEVEDPGNQDNRPTVVESDDAAEYYRQAVGEEPDEGMYSFSTEPSLYSLCFVVLYFCATLADKITFYIYFSPSHLDMFPAAKRRQDLKGPQEDPSRRGNRSLVTTGKTNMVPSHLIGPVREGNPETEWGVTWTGKRERDLGMGANLLERCQQGAKGWEEKHLVTGIKDLEGSLRGAVNLGVIGVLSLRANLVLVVSGRVLEG